MSISFVEIASHASTAGADHLDNDLSTVPVDDLIILAFAFEGVAPGSGPWVSPDDPAGASLGPANGWKQILWKPPSATGVGLEVWAAIYGSGGHILAQFDASYAVQAVTAIYSGEYTGSPPFILNGAVRGAVSEQVSGDNPDAPSVYSFVDELVIVIGADTLASPGWGTPTPAGWSSRADYTRSGYGTAEITVADKPTTVEGDTGAIPFSATASPAGAKGATATLAIRPAPPASSSPLIAVEFAVAN